MNARQNFFRFIFPLRKLYWQICKPKTFGVKVLIVHPTKKEEVLIVTHAYGDRKRLNIPGGGYDPKKETPFRAAMREIQEELGVTLVALHKLGDYYSEGEGKRDSVIIFRGVLKDSDVLKHNNELREITWMDLRTIRERSNVAKILQHAVALYTTSITNDSNAPI